MPQRPDNEDRKRLLWISLGICFLFCLLIATFFNVQIIEQEKWKKKAEIQHYIIVQEPFHRGVFYSNTSVKKGIPFTKVPFVIDIQKWHLYADPFSISKPFKEIIVAELARLLKTSDEEKKNMAAHLMKKSRSRKLVSWLEENQKKNIEKWWGGFAKQNKIPRNALYFVSDYQRMFPFGSMLGQVLHTIQEAKDEKSKQAFPTGGLELYFHRYLKGKLGKKRLMRSPRHSLEIDQIEELPQNGADVYLTINHHLQAIAEEELEFGVKKFQAKSGWAVMMDPYTGEILALAQYPFFYPPNYQLFFNDKERIQQTKIKAITDANEPGSVMKPITMAVAFFANEELKKRGERPLFDPNEKMDTSNPYFPGRKKPLTDTHFHHYLNMYMALQRSSNIYCARLVERIIDRLGEKWYRQVLSETFGLGEKTGVELPSESGGVLPMPGKLHPNGTFEWSKPTPFSLAIGHNIQVTSFQLLRLYALFANGGIFVQPTVVKKIVQTVPGETEKIFLDNTTPERVKKFPRVIPDSLAKELTKALKFSTKNGGTATKANIPGYSEAGKTGTANKIENGGYSPKKYVATFIGFAPTQKPAFVLLVTMDEPLYGYIPGLGKNHNGGCCSASVFREIGRRSLEYLGVPSDDPYGYPPGDPRYNPQKADWIQETRELQEMYEKWNNNAKTLLKK